MSSGGGVPDSEPYQTVSPEGHLTGASYRSLLQPAQTGNLHTPVTRASTDGIHAKSSVLFFFLLPSGLSTVGFTGPAGVPVCRSGPGGGSSSVRAPRPTQPEP